MNYFSHCKYTANESIYHGIEDVFLKLFDLLIAKSEYNASKMSHHGHSMMPKHNKVYNDCSLYKLSYTIIFIPK